MQTDVASACGVSQASVSGWMNGSIPRGNRLVQLASVLEVTPGELLGGADQPATIPREHGTQSLKQMYLEQKARADRLEKELKKITAIVDNLKGKYP